MGVGLLLLAAPAWPQDRPIQDNSFLIEEAYNQEAGVVQHISLLELPRHGNEWTFDFTQEWPLRSQRHQLSLTVPGAHVEERDQEGLGDVAINYRYQLVGSGEERVAFAPRVSLLLPTGDETEGLGTGAAGIEVNLPLSVVLSDRLVGHWNAGGGLTPSAQSLGTEGDLESVFLGQGLIWLVRPRFNVLLEALWERSEIAVDDFTFREESFVVSPGARLAQDFASGLQIVYGLAAPYGVGESEGERSVLLYLSFEHPFL